jgi:ketosteroid isomerase-like protein
VSTLADDSLAVAALRELDGAFDAALSAGDTRTLAAVLADDFVYTHSTGVSQAKQTFIDQVAARQTRSLRQTSDVSVQLHGDVAITCGNLTMAYSTGRPDHRLRYIRVYRRTSEAWQPIAHCTFEAAHLRPPGAP